MPQLWQLGLFAALFASGAAAAPQMKPIVTPEDYPASALSRNEQGTVYFRLTIGTDGRVKDCQITRSSGYRDLDESTCRIMMERARFKPALGRDGQPVEFTRDDKVGWYFQ